MSETVHRLKVLASCLVIAGTAMTPRIASAAQHPGRGAQAEHAIAGEVKKVDHGAHILVIRTADGFEETIGFTDRTAVRGLRDVTRAADAGAKAGLEGGAIVLYYTGEGAHRTAVSLDHMGKRTLRIAKGTVARVGDAGKYVAIKTSAGSEETFELTKDTVVDGSRGIEHVAVVTGGTIKKGAEVAVHYSEDGDRKVAHLVKHL